MQPISDRMKRLMAKALGGSLIDRLRLYRAMGYSYARLAELDIYTGANLTQLEVRDMLEGS